MKNLLHKIYLNLSNQCKNHLIILGYDLLVFVYLEIALHLSVYKSLSSSIVYPILFALIAGSILFFISSLFSERINRILGFSLITLTVIYYEVQLIYRFIFGTFMSVSQMMMGADAVTNFFSQLMYAILTHLLFIIILLLPIPITAILFFRKILHTRRILPLQTVGAAIIAGFFTLATVLTLHLTNTSSTSAYAILINPNTSSEASIRTVGLLATTIQETGGFLATQNTDGERFSFAETALDTAKPSKDANNLDISFTTADKSVEQINQYLSATAPTSKNEYTGLAKDYNVVTICAEAFSPLLIDQELTPTLHKLSTNGFIFNNFYNSFPNTTTNGEYTFCTGLLPNMSRNKIDSSFNLSADNYMPYCLGNALGDLGYETYAYHNYYATFYDRHITHKNMGYNFKAIAQGLDIPIENPCSDLEMMLASMEDYIDSDRPFHAYYMTYSGHYQYNWENAMSLKHKKEVEQLPYSETVKAYIACNLELEYALDALMDALKRAGKAENTMIVLTTDHYPYGLPNEAYNELAGHTVDQAFEKYKNSFICYVPNLEPVKVDKYCSTPDILPTLLNLLGVDYDSRLLAGKDVLSDAVGIAILSDQSFITSEFMYNAATGTAVSHGETKVDPQALQEHINYVANRFSLSTAILDTDYYAHVFGETSSINKTDLINYTDIESPYIESAVTFMVENKYMHPQSKTEFGLIGKNTMQEFLRVLYKMHGSPALKAQNGTEKALAWALAEGIVDDPSVWNTDVTYSSAAEMIYRYTALCTGKSPKPNADKLAERASAYPAIPEDALRAQSWCSDNGIITGANLEKPYEEPQTPITRHQIATYLQRMYLMLNNE